MERIFRAWRSPGSGTGEKRPAVEPEEAPLRGHPERAAVVGVHGRQRRGQNLRTVAEADVAVTKSEKRIEGSDPDTSVRRRLDSADKAEVRERRDLVRREPVQSVGGPCPDVALAVFEQGGHREAGQRGRFLDCRRLPVRAGPHAPKAPSQRANPQIASSIVHERAAPRFLSEMNRHPAFVEPAKTHNLIAHPDRAEAVLADALHGFGKGASLLEPVSRPDPDGTFRAPCPPESCRSCPHTRYTPRLRARHRRTVPSDLRPGCAGRVGFPAQRVPSGCSKSIVTAPSSNPSLGP